MEAFATHVSFVIGCISITAYRYAQETRTYDVARSGKRPGRLAGERAQQVGNGIDDDIGLVLREPEARLALGDHG